MMMKLIFGIGLMFISLVINAQISGKSIPELRRELQTPPPLSTFQLVNLSAYQLPISKTDNPINRHTAIPNFYSYDELAFFCKIEVKLEKAVKLPIKFRLGDVEYVDRLEGKRE